MHKITSGLYVGARWHASDTSLLEKHQIDTVVTAMEDSIETTTHHYPLVDGDNETEYFQEVVSKVREHICSPETVLVHCRSGRSRSPTVVAAALARVHEEPLSESMSRVRDSGRYVHPTTPIYRLAQEAVESK